MKFIFCFLVFLDISFATPSFEYRPGLVVNGYETDSFPCARSNIADSPSIFDGSRAFKFPAFSQGLKLPVGKLFRETGIRFDFVADSLQTKRKLKWAEKIVSSDTVVRLFSLVTGDRESGPYTEYLLDLLARKKGGDWNLYIVFNSLNNGPILFNRNLGRLGLGTVYGVDLTIRSDSSRPLTTFECLINGKKVLIQDIGGMRDKLKKLELWFGSVEHDFELAGALYVDNLAVGPGRLGRPPLKPGLTAREKKLSRALADEIRLISPPFQPLKPGARLLFSQYQLTFLGGDWRFPLFDSDLEDKFRDSLVLSLTLDPLRKYLWRVRHFGMDTSFSDWSDPVGLDFQPVSPDARTFKVPVIHRVRIALPGRPRPLDTLEKGRWYELTIKGSTAKGFEDMGYSIFWANRAEYPCGNVRNKGGAFQPASNYVFNLSVDPKCAYEKKEPGLYRTTRLCGITGLYVDGADSSYRVNPSDSTLRVLVRFPASAIPGEWCLRGFVRAAGEVTSAMHYSRFTLIEHKELPSPDAHVSLRGLLLAGLLLAGLFAAGWAFRRYRKRHAVESVQIQSREQELFGKLDAYIRTNLAKEIAITDLETHMSMSYSSIHRLMKAADKGSVKVYIQTVKMEKAQELLRTTNLSIAEIMGAVGFNDAAYFSKTFKKFSELPPRQYREKHQKQA